MSTPNPADILRPIVEAMRQKDFELDTDNAGAMLSAFTRARAKGVQFDDFTLALVDVLKRQIALTFADVEDEPDFEDTPDDDGWTMEGIDDDGGPMEIHDPAIARRNAAKAARI